MSHILFDNITNENFVSNKIELYSEVVFDTSSNVILFPSLYYKQNEQLLKSKYSNCDTLKSDNIQTIRCNSIDNLLSLSFILNGYALTLDNNLLFKQNGDLYEMQLSFSDTINDIIIGLPFFEQFQIAFDGEKNIMLFYNKDTTKIDNFRKYTDDKDFLFKEHIILIISMIVVFILFIVMGIIMFLRFKRKQDEKKALERASYGKLI